MITFIPALLGIVILTAVSFCLGWQFAHLVPVWVKQREEKKEARQREKFHSLQYYVNHMYRRA